MKIKDLTQIWISSPNRTNVDGEFTTTWVYQGTEYLNLQQDLNELDRNQMGEVDYSIVKGRTTLETIIKKGDGIYLVDVSSSTNPTPKYTVKAIQEIGTTKIITLNQFNG